MKTITLEGHSFLPGEVLSVTAFIIKTSNFTIKSRI